MKQLLLIIAILGANPVFGFENLTLPDGRQVQLNDDFTWHYIENIKSVPKQNNIEQGSVAVIPVKKITATTIVPNSNKNTLQLSDSGVDVLLGKATYSEGELTIPTSITNQGSSSIILIELEYQVFDTVGKALIKDKKAIWQSVKRMSDTYLRPDESKLGKELKIELPEQPQYQMTSKIIAVEFR